MSKTALVLGGTSPHKLLIDKLKRRGFYVILVDYLDNPPAKEIADEHIKASTLDQDAVLAIAKERKADLVISACIDQANSVCCYVAEKLNLPHPYSYKTSLDVTNKGLMKRIMRENGIPTSSFVTVSSPDRVGWDAIRFPSVVKPVDCNSSKGVKRVDNREEAEAALADAIHMSRTHEAIMEGYNVGSEIQVDCLATSSGVKVMMTRQKQKIVSDGKGMVLQSFGSIFPAPLNNVQKAEAQSIAEKIAAAFDLRNTPFFYQAIITEEGISVLEFAPRIGGGLSYSILKDFGSYDAVEYAIDSYLGKELDAVPHIPKDMFLSSVLVYVRRGVFDHLEGFDDLISTGVIDSGFLMKAKGNFIDEDLRSSNRVAAFIVTEKDYQSLQSKARQAFSSIEAYDVEGKPMINRSIYPFV